MLTLLKVRVEAFTQIHHHQSEFVLFPALIVPLAADPLARPSSPPAATPRLYYTSETPRMLATLAATQTRLLL